MGRSLQQRLDGAIAILNQFGILPSEDETSQMAELLDDVVEIDAGKITAIGRVMQYMGAFNELVRSEIKDARVATRYQQISGLFDSIVSDAKTMIGHVEDNRIDWQEKIAASWMTLVRGGIPKRFDRIKRAYLDVARDTKAHLDREERILTAFGDFRGAVKAAEVMAYEVKDTQAGHVEAARLAYETAQDAAHASDGDQATRARLQLARDEAYGVLQHEEKQLRLLTDLAEHLKIGYHVSETVMAKLGQTHDAKDQVYNRSVTFFATNEHVFTALAATYVAQFGLHEATQTLNTMTEGVNKSLETMAEIGGQVEAAALEAAHGPTIRAESLKKLVDAVVDYQMTSREKIRDLREANTKNVAEIELVVEEGKAQARQAVRHYVAG